MSEADDDVVEAGEEVEEDAAVEADCSAVRLKLKVCDIALMVEQEKETG